MRVIFMGTPEFAVHSLRKLDECHEVVAVVTQPDKPKGRGKKVTAPPVKEYAVLKGIPVLQPTRIKTESFFNELFSFLPDVIIVAAYGRLLPERILNEPKFGCINVHASLLPKYRGAAPVHWAVINGEKSTGVTIMYMAKELDSGDMILKKELPIEPQDTAGALLDKLGTLGADALIEALSLIEAGTAGRVKQDEKLMSYAPMLTSETGKIDWNATGDSIVNKIRGLNPEPSAYTYCGGETIKLYMAEKVESGEAGKPGEITGIVKNKGFVVRCGDSNVLVTQVQASGGKKMSAADYMRGHKLEIGDVLG